ELCKLFLADLAEVSPISTAQEQVGTEIGTGELREPHIAVEVADRQDVHGLIRPPRCSGSPPSPGCDHRLRRRLNTSGLCGRRGSGQIHEEESVIQDVKNA